MSVYKSVYPLYTNSAMNPMEVSENVYFDCLYTLDVDESETRTNVEIVAYLWFQDAATTMTERVKEDEDDRLKVDLDDVKWRFSDHELKSVVLQHLVQSQSSTLKLVGERYAAESGWWANDAERRLKPRPHPAQFECVEECLVMVCAVLVESTSYLLQEPTGNVWECLEQFDINGEHSKGHLSCL